MAKFADQDIDQLFRAILTLESIDECNRFCEDLCTINEIKSLAQRLEVARMLKVGHTYTHIEQQTGASTATISRVKRCLNYGADGYQTVLARLLTEEAERPPLTNLDDQPPTN